MAIVKSHGVAPGALSFSTVITDPPDIRAGNLLVAGIVQDSNTASWSEASGLWTQLLTLPSTDALMMDVWWKIADSTDVGQASHTFTSDSNVSCHGGMMVIQDFDPVTPIDSSVITETTPANLTVTIGTMTIASPGCLLLMFVSSDDNFTTSGYSIATNNPTWNEQFDLLTTAGADCCIAGAWGQRRQMGATGAGSATFAINGNPGAKRDIGAMVAIKNRPRQFSRMKLKPAPFKPGVPNARVGVR